jgi:hypothetical protein
MTEISAVFCSREEDSLQLTMATVGSVTEYCEVSCLSRNIKKGNRRFSIDYMPVNITLLPAGRICCPELQFSEHVFLFLVALSLH